MTSSVRPTTPIAQPDSDFRDFVVGFADPLARLAFVLTAGLPATPATAPDLLAANALARVRRQWRDANDSGSPELVAVEMLLSNLTRHRGARRRDKSPSSWTAEALTVGSLDTTDADAEIDLDRVRAGLWLGFQQLPVRHRVPLVFADPSVASRRLAGLGVPTSFASERRQDVLLDAALLDVRTVLRVLPATTAAADALTDDEIVAALGDAIREHASEKQPSTDPYPVVIQRARQIRRRTVFTAAAVAVVLAVGAVGVVRVSTPPKVRAAVTASNTSPRPAPQLPQPVVRPVANADARPVIDWPARGNAADDAVLLAQVKSDFVVAHPDEVGAVQVLLAQDTPAFRVAYLTANSPKGVLQSWFYGVPGSDNLVEGASSYGGSLVANASVLASAVVNAAQQTELVVIAPPSTTDMQLADFDFSKPAPADAGFHPLAFHDGVATKPIETGAVDALVLKVSVGGAEFTAQRMPTVALAPILVGAGSPSSPVVERGQTDQVLLLKALQVAAVWQRQDTSVPVASPVALWGGTDAAGTRLVVVRAQTQFFGLIVLEWSGDVPGMHGELLVNKAAPEVPVAFTYRGIGGIRVGVIAPTGATKASVTVDGKQVSSAVDATGFASLPMGASAAPATHDAASDVAGANGLDVEGEVTLSNAAGQVVAIVPFPPQV